MITEPRQHYAITLAVLLTGAMAYALSQTMVAPALPEIQRELDTSTTTVTFVLTAYLLTASVATPIVGRLGDMFGKERLLVITLGVFGLGSLIAALSHSIGMLIAGRAVQGVGGAVFPLSFGIIRDEFPPRRVATGIGLISATFGIGGGAGLVLSGVIVDHLSYEWIFWLALAVIVVAVIATRLFVPESPVKSPTRIDWGGAALMSSGLVALLIGVSEGNTWGWGSGRIVGLFTTAAVLLVVWIAYERRQPMPLVDMAMMRARAVLTTNLTAFLVGFGMFGSFILIPQFVQMPVDTGYGFGASVTEAGLFLLPSTTVMLVAGPLSGWLGGRLGSKLPLLIGTLMATVSFVFLAIEHDTRWSIYVGTALLGLGIGFAFAAMANLIVEAVDQRQTGVATGMNTIMRTIGGSIGGQVAASIVAGHVAAGSGLPSESGFEIAFVMSAIGVAFAFAAALAIPGRRARAREAAESGEAQGLAGAPTRA
ncbi:MAG TPA: MFS transporter [Solirubrobacterales bacterium]|nr:MFS transporter [Solirubrobacterales bacterium]